MKEIRKTPIETPVEPALFTLSLTEGMKRDFTSITESLMGDLRPDYAAAEDNLDLAIRLPSIIREVDDVNHIGTSYRLYYDHVFMNGDITRKSRVGQETIDIDIANPKRKEGVAESVVKWVPGDRLLDEVRINLGSTDISMREALFSEKDTNHPVSQQVQKAVRETLDARVADILADFRKSVEVPTPHTSMKPSLGKIVLKAIDKLSVPPQGPKLYGR